MSDFKSAEIGKGKPGPGRPPGMVNKTTAVAKDAIAMVAEGLGGVERMIAWAREDALNERSFWTTIYPKLIPVTLSGDKDNPVKMTFEWLPPQPPAKPKG